MPEDPRVQQLIEEMADSRKSAEDLCRDVPELLVQVRQGWRRFQAIEARIGELFPEPDSVGDDKAAAREIAPPQIPGYDVLDVLGRGGVGVVYKAVHRRLNRTVALKMLLAGAFATRAEHRRFAREAEAVAALRHPNVIQIHDVGDVDGRPYFTMELVDGNSLAQRLGGTPLPATEAAALSITLAGAVHAAHQAGIVHRDLKPANVLLTSDGTPKISDFGLARRLDDKASLTRTGTAVGTPSYMAPEQARGRADAAGPAADVYALGAILYELLTGRPPFRAETAEETVQQLLSEDPVPPCRLNGKVPRDLETICLKCLNKDPRLRYATAAALTDDLRRFLEGRPIHARPSSWIGKIWRSSRRNPAGAALVSSVFVLLGLALGGGLWLERQQSEHAAERARQEGRTAQGVEAALEQAAAHRAQGRWLEAKAALAAAPGLMDTDALADLPRRVRQACSDIDCATELEAIRLGMSEGRGSDEKTPSSAPRLYAAAFGKYGIELSTLDPAPAAASVRGSAIRDTLLAYLHDWLYWISEEQRGSLRAVLDLADDDPWRRAYRAALEGKDTRKLVALAAEPGAPDQPPMILSGLGGTLLVHDLREETLTLLREAQRRHPSDFWINYLLGHVLERENPREAVGYFRAAVALRPRSDQAYRLLGRALRGAGDGAGAVAALQEAFALNPSRTGVWDLARELAPAGRLEEVRAAWEKYLERDPPDHDSWHGYAQLCLFLGNDAAYRWARAALLDRFGDRPVDWIVAERTATACLLQPLSGDQFRRVLAVADRAAVDAARFAKSDNAFVTFVTGLAEYRQGRLDHAVRLLRDAADKLRDRAGPRLVLAMAQFRSGSTRDACQSLATAVGSFHWEGAAEETSWVSHVLRREAENMILPHVPPFVRRGQQRRDPDERVALAGIYRSRGLNYFAARIFREGFAVDPRVADDLTAECLDRAENADKSAERTEILNSECRYVAARCAAMVGSGLGNDGVELGEAERADWRRQARQWLRADLTYCGKPATGGTQMAGELVKRLVALWRNESDLAGLREPSALEKFSPAERQECQTLWSDVDSLLERVEGRKH